MISTPRVGRSNRVFAGAAAALLATLILVPAHAQEAGAPRPQPYVELMTSTVSANRYVRYVDGDAETVDPQQDFTSLTPLTFSDDPELVTIAASANPQTLLAGTGCLNGAGAPIGPLPAVTPAHYIQPPPFAWLGPLPVIGVTSYTCAAGATPAIVAEDSKASIRPGEILEIARGADLPLDFRSLKLSINATDASAVRVTAKSEGSVVGTIDVNLAVDCVNSTDWENDPALCATRVVPYFGALKMRYLNLDFGEPFDSFEVTATAGVVRLKGRHPSRFFLNGEAFGGTIGGETGQSSVSEPPTETLPGYETSCTDAADPPPEGPCGGKEVALTISRFLADVDGDGNVEQVLNVVPTGAVEDLALLTVTIHWAAESAPVGAIPLSGVDEDADGPDDDDPAAWCSVDPPGAPGDEWCLATFSSDSAGPGQIQVSETFQGTGDPKFAR